MDAARENQTEKSPTATEAHGPDPRRQPGTENGPEHAARDQANGAGSKGSTDVVAMSGSDGADAKPAHEAASAVPMGAKSPTGSAHQTPEQAKDQPAQPAKGATRPAGQATPVAKKHSAQATAPAPKHSVKADRPQAKVAKPAAQPVRQAPKAVQKPSAAATAHAAMATVEQTTPRKIVGDSMEGSSDAAQIVFNAWAASAQASLRSALEVQTATLSAGLSLFGLAETANREFARQWYALARQAQQTAMAAWQAGFHSAERATSHNA